MNVTIENRQHRLFRIVTHFGMLKIYIPLPMSWTPEMSAHLRWLEQALPVELPHHQSRVFLESEMNDYISMLAARDLPIPQTVSVTLAIPTLEQTVEAQQQQQQLPLPSLFVPSPQMQQQLRQEITEEELRRLGL